VANVEKTRQAVIDLDECFDYLAKEAGIKKAKAFVKSAHESFHYLAKYPEAGAPLHIYRPQYMYVRKWPVEAHEKYLIFYQPWSSGWRRGVEIIRVIHSSRDWWRNFEITITS
jgi:plasmid stabilization system protein ParE